MINHLCDMGGRYLVTMIPGHMEMYWGSVLICATYGNVFWGITLWLAVCVRSVATVQAALDPEWCTRAFWILAMYVSEVCETSWQGISQQDKNTLKWTPGVILLTQHANSIDFIVVYATKLLWPSDAKWWHRS